MFLPLSAQVSQRGESGSAVSVRVADEGRRRHLGAHFGGRLERVHGIRALDVGNGSRCGEPRRGTHFFLRNWTAKLSGREGCLFTTGWRYLRERARFRRGGVVGRNGRCWRLDFSTRKHAGCDLAMMGAEPGSSSQRNAERQGFRIAYTRTKWILAR